MAEDQSQAQPPQNVPIDTRTDVPTDSPADVPAGASAGASLGNEPMSDEISLPNPLVLAAIGLVLLSIVTFLPTLRGEATWLDDVSLTDNPFVQATDGVARFWTSPDRAGRYQPMTLTSFWLGYRLFHNSLVAEHFINVLMHAAVVLLLWTILRRSDVPGAWFAAAIFAVHPVHTQAVAWISGRSVVLASVFYLSAVLVYLRFLSLDQPVGEKTLFTLPPEPERLWGLSFALFLCAMLSNAAAAVTFPVAVAVLLWWKRGKLTGKEWLGLIPFFIAAIAGGIWVGWLQARSLAANALVSAFGPTSVADRIHIAFRAIWFYAAKIVWPYPLIFDYPRWTDVLGPGALCGFALVIVLLLLWIMRARLGRGLLAAVVLFIIAIVPMLNLLDPPAIRYSFVDDNRQYLASAALIILIAALATRIVTAEKWRDKLNPSYCAGAVLIVLAILSFHQGTFYLTDESVWKQTIADNKNSLLADEGYADVLLAAGGHDPALFSNAADWYQHAQALAPNDPRAAVGLGTVAAAQAYEDQASGQTDIVATQQTAAEQYFHDAIHNDPDYKPAYVALARLMSWKKDDLAAIDALKEAVRIEPDWPSTRLQLGAAQRRVGDLADAEKTLSDLEEDTPNVAAVHSELGNVYIQQNRLQDALAEWQKAIQLDPTDTAVMLNFGYLLDSSGETELAAKQFQAATIIDPSLVQAHLALAHVYTKLGHRHDAVMQLTQAVALDPTDTKARDALVKAEDDETKHGPGTPAGSQPSSGPTTGADMTNPIPASNPAG
jgi:Tfp pilus assembly protein PilF